MVVQMLTGNREQLSQELTKPVMVSQEIPVSFIGIIRGNYKVRDRQNFYRMQNLSISLDLLYELHKLFVLIINSILIKGNF